MGQRGIGAHTIQLAEVGTARIHFRPPKILHYQGFPSFRIHSTTPLLRAQHQFAAVSMVFQSFFNLYSIPSRARISAPFTAGEVPGPTRRHAFGPKLCGKQRGRFPPCAAVVPRRPLAGQQINTTAPREGRAESVNRSDRRRRELSLRRPPPPLAPLIRQKPSASTAKNG